LSFSKHYLYSPNNTTSVVSINTKALPVTTQTAQLLAFIEYDR